MNFALFSIALTIALFCNGSTGYLLGGNFGGGDGTPTKAWECLKKNFNMQSALLPIYDRDAIPKTAVNINDARSGGFTNVNGLIIAYPNSKTTVSKIFEKIFTNLTDNNVKIDNLYLAANNPYSYDQEPSANIAFINSMIDEAKNRGYTMGIVTSEDSWFLITANTEKFSKSPLTYVPKEVTHLVDDFDKYKSFGGWKKPNSQVYWTEAKICNANGIDLYYGSKGDHTF